MWNQNFFVQKTFHLDVRFRSNWLCISILWPTIEINTHEWWCIIEISLIISIYIDAVSKCVLHHQWVHPYHGIISLNYYHSINWSKNKSFFWKYSLYYVIERSNRKSFELWILYEIRLRKWSSVWTNRVFTFEKKNFFFLKQKKPFSLIYPALKSSDA